MSWCPVHQVNNCEHIHLTKSKLNKKRAAMRDMEYEDYVNYLAKKAYGKLIVAGEGAHPEELDQP